MSLSKTNLEDTEWIMFSRWPEYCNSIIVLVSLSCFHDGLVASVHILLVLSNSEYTFALSSLYTTAGQTTLPQEIKTIWQNKWGQLYFIKDHLYLETKKIKYFCCGIWFEHIQHRSQILKKQQTHLVKPMSWD